MMKLKIKDKKWLKNKRIEKGLTQKELAEKLGLSVYTIANIERGIRQGNYETWYKLINFFENNFVSFDSENLIKEIKKDIKKFGEDYPCVIFYKEINDSLIFTNYDFICEEKPISKKELDENEYTLNTTLKDALELFEHQNKIL